MRSLSKDLVLSLDLEGALIAEAASTQNLIPDTPGWNELTSRSTEFAKWLSGQLLREYAPARQVIVNVRKLGYGIRPVSILAIPDRVLYRALVSHILKDCPPVQRDTESYLRFLMAPIETARKEERAKSPRDPNDKKIFFSVLGSSIYTHVVKSDIVAYYQYVDHGILGNELFNLSGEYEAIDALLEFLLEVQGREHGIPQLLIPSDELSEIYMQVLVRALLRHGLPTWNFSDDLRILCKSYEESRWAIEVLNGSASDIGLAINEGKTSTPRFASYVMETIGVKEDEEIGEDAEPDAEANIGEYTEFFDEDQTADAAVSVLASAQLHDRRSSENEPLILLQKASAENLRAIRRAISRLRSLDDARGLEHVVRIVPFLAVITPTVCRYLIKLCESGNIKEVSSAFDKHSEPPKSMAKSMVHSCNAVNGLA